MACLMICSDIQILLIGRLGSLAVGQHLCHCSIQVLQSNDASIGHNSTNGSLVEQGRNTRARHTDRLPCQLFQGNIRRHMPLCGVQLDDSQTVSHIGQRDNDLPVKPAGSDQGCIQILKVIGRSNS